MMLKRISPVLLVLLMAFGLFACSSYNPSLGIRVKNPDGTWHIEPRVVINGSKTAKKLAVDSINSHLVANIPRAEVNVRNVSSKTLNFAYRFAWSDANGAEMEAPGGGWSDAWVNGYESKTLQGSGLNSRATTFRLIIQEK